MFAFFLNGSFFSFWQNEPGQTFFDLTVKGMKWDASIVSLRYYQGLSSVPNFFRFEANGDLVIQEQISTPSEVEGEDPVMTYSDLNTVQSEAYFENGNMVKTC